MREEFISFGGGVQTTAMILIGDIINNVDEVIFADTGAEHPETYAYIAKYVKPYLMDKNVPFTTVRMKKQIRDVETDERLEATSLREAVWHRKRVPSLMNRWCTEYSKITPIKLYLRQMQKDGIYVKPATGIIGISIDEKHRSYNKDGSWKQPHHSEYRNEYPMVVKQISRNDCKKLIREFGWPEPVKSGCYFCPFQGGKEWQKLYMNSPSLFWDAVSLEERDIKFPKYRLYQRKPLRSLAVSFGEGNMSLFDDYEGSACVEVEASCMM